MIILFLADDYALLAEAIEDIDIANAVLVNTVKYKDNIPQNTKEKADVSLSQNKGKKRSYNEKLCSKRS